MKNKKMKTRKMKTRKMKTRKMKTRKMKTRKMKVIRVEGGRRSKSDPVDMEDAIEELIVDSFERLKYINEKLDELNKMEENIVRKIDSKYGKMFTFFELHCADKVNNFYCEEQNILQNLDAIYNLNKYISGKKKSLDAIKIDLISIEKKIYISIESLNSAEEIVKKNYEPGAIYFDNFSELRKYLNKALDSNDILIEKVDILIEKVDILIEKVDELQKSTI